MRPSRRFGLAFAEAETEEPSLGIVRYDGYPQIDSTDLGAAVIYATVFDRSPEGLYCPDRHMSEDDAALLQRIAWEAVQEWKEGTAAE